MLILALDFGGTKLSAAMAEAGSAGWLGQRRQLTPPGAHADDEYRTMLELAQTLIQEVGQPAAVGVSFGGPTDAEAGVIHLSHHVPGWENVPLRQRLTDQLGLPVAVENDANAGALGEYAYGAGRGCRSMLYVTVSTGIGGGWVIDGQLFRGRDGMAGEIGHVVVNPGGAACACGKQGCLEAEACGPAIARRAHQAIAAQSVLGRALLARLGKPLGTLTAQDIAAAAQEDSLAASLLKTAGHYLGRGLAMAIGLLNPDRIVLGGGVTKAGDLWWQAVEEAARTYSLPEASTEILPAHFEDDAPLWGAVTLGQQLMEATRNDSGPEGF